MRRGSREDGAPPDYDVENGDVGLAHRVVWGVAAVLALGVLGLFGWNLAETVGLKSLVAAEFAKLNVKLDTNDANVKTLSDDYTDLARRVSVLEREREPQNGNRH